MDRLGKPCPEALGDYFFCEAFGFQLFPWDMDEMPVDVISYWSSVVGTWKEEKAKQEYYREKRQAWKSKVQGK